MEFKHLADLIKKQKNLDLKKLSYIMQPAEMDKLIQILQNLLVSPLPLLNNRKKSLTIILSQVPSLTRSWKTLQMRQSQPMGLEAMSRELYSSLKIEQIHTARDSIRQILSGLAPSTSLELEIYRMKLGLDFISDPANEISEANLLELYEMVFKDQLPDKNKPSPVTGYRDDVVYVMGSRMDRLVHTGAPFELLPELMNGLIEFARNPGQIDDLTAAAILHFYLAWLHPWFDGNGRMARFLHLWYLVQKGYPSTLYTPLSEYIESSKQHYYKAFTLCEQNEDFLGSLDVTPFVIYFNRYVYSQIELTNNESMDEIFTSALQDGKVTAKEKELWAFVVSAYGSEEFSTKQLEKDFREAAYQTIYKFVHKFESLGLLSSQPYGNRVRYRIRK